MGGSKNQTSTTTTEPPKFAQPYLEQGLREASRDYGRGPQQQFPGNRITPFSQQSQMAMQMAQNRALQGSPVTNAAQNYATRVLNGGYLQQGNPALDHQINRAIQLSRTALDSQFGGAGRDLQAQLPARAEQIKNITNDFLYRNYNDERNRMQSMVPQAGALAQQDYQDIGQLANVGASVEDMTSRIIADRASRFDFDQTTGDRNLDQYLIRTGQITPQLGGTSISSGPGGNNLLGQTGGFLGGLGTLIGAMNQPGKIVQG